MLKIDPAAHLKSAVGEKTVNAFSIDVEDYFQVAAFDDVIDRRSWDARPLRVERNVDTFLDLLNRHNTKATFFTLGWVAERMPAMVRRIVDQGHELASHGYGHQKVNSLSPDEFRADVLKAKHILEDLSGHTMNGYRAPSFSIGASNLWAHDILFETGHRYSSSVYPVQTDHYGMPDAPRFAWRSPSGLLEIPPSSLRFRERNFPASGGGYFRLLPFGLSKWGFNKINAEHQAAIFYCHPWEIDDQQPRIPNARLRSKFRHYVNLSTNLAKIDRLLGWGNWDRMDIVFASMINATEDKSV
jgi:polysaccharide deacetylase family protein (PEP-CTERM system associated)